MHKHNFAMTLIIFQYPTLTPKWRAKELSH